MENNKLIPISAWAEEERPREKLSLKGRSALSDAELLGILIGTGTTDKSAVDLGREILIAYNHSLQALAKADIKELTRFHGIGEAKAITIVSAMELSRRRLAEAPEKLEQIQSAADVFRIMHPHLQDLRHEEFWILLLNRANRVIKKISISSGGITGTIADPRLIFKPAVESLASGIILIHNHPSGNTQPSEADRQLTKKLKQAGLLLDIQVLDHVIFTDHSYFSFADEGTL